MRSSLINFLKHNERLMSVVSSVGSRFIRSAGRFVKTDDELVLFVSYMGKGFDDSPKVLYDRLKSDPKYGSLQLVWAFEDPSEYPDIEAVRIDTPRYFKTALKAKYWITNTNIERGLHFKKKGTRYLNTWHGVALKRIGNDCPERSDYDFSEIDYLVVSGEHDEKVFKTAFNAKPQSYLRCGMPRNEELWDADDDSLKRARARLGLPETATIALYAPTWRDADRAGKSDGNTFDPNAWLEALGEESILLMRAHHLDSLRCGYTPNDRLIDVSGLSNVNDLLLASDLLITDYSAIAFDYSILQRPILCYVYDYDEYERSRGLYFDMFGTYPCIPCRTEEELLLQLRTLDRLADKDAIRQFRDAFMQYHGSSTEQCLKELFGA